VLDLSNLNPGPIDFARIYRAGQRRVYLKATEGLTFEDSYYRGRRLLAQRVGLKVGAYHFSHSEHNPAAQEARHFCTVIGPLKPGYDLRPCLDFEFGATSAAWALAFLDEAERILGVRPIIYSYPDFLQRAKFAKVPAALWLASYGRNDGVEHPYAIPLPWHSIVAHQYSSRATMPGVPGLVDISHVYTTSALEIPPR
jgi:lysozyme